MDLILVLSLFLCASTALGSDASKNESDSGGGIISPGALSLLFDISYAVLSSTNRTVKFSFYTRNSLKKPEVFREHVRRTIFPTFENNKPLKVLIHGWQGSDGEGFLSMIREGLLKVEDVNLVTVDWSEHGSKNKLYPISKDKVPEVAVVVAKFLDELHDKYKVRLEEIHVLGHSLGAHIAGIAGRNVKNGKIGRITGLDPAGPGFQLNETSSRLSPESANFVDVIHTCADYLGFVDPIGHADFYPNSGFSTQPGCGLDWNGVCSHGRSYEFFIESIANQKAFPSVSCSSWEDFKKDKKTCDLNNVVYMGEGVSTRARGVFYLSTNENSPFGTGKI